MSQPESDEETESLDPLSYAYQFAEILAGIDAQIFSPHQAAIEPVVLRQFFPGIQSGGYHVQRVVTYDVLQSILRVPPVAPIADASNNVPRDFYFIWGKEVEKVAKKKLTGTGTLEKFSDADFRQMLIACAMVAVRHRVLLHKEFFPDAKLRTFTNMFRDETIPEAHRAMLFLKKSGCPQHVFAHPEFHDPYILLCLIDLVQAEKQPIEAALHYLTNT